MVRFIDTRAISFDETNSSARSLRKLFKDPGSDQIDLRVQLLGAWSRFVRCHKGSFKKTLDLWIARRIEAGFPVDPVDPDAKEPSDFFKADLKKRFQKERKS